ncbi:MAG: phosphoglycerate mutase family protein [Nitrospirota bacterium]
MQNRFFLGFKKRGVLIVGVSVLVSLMSIWFSPAANAHLLLPPYHKTVIIVRHAEKVDPSPLNDDLVPLSSDGFARAETLREVMANSGVSAIYVTQKLRTRQTAQPLATLRGIVPIQVNTGNESNLIKKVRASTSKVILIVAHSDTVSVIVAGLGGGVVTVGNEFDNLFVLTLTSPLNNSKARLIKATYGAPR